MDPFSLTTGLIGAVAVAAHVAKKLKELKDYINDAEGTITSLIDEISLLETSLRVFQNEAEKIRTTTATADSVAALYQHLDLCVPKVDKLLQELGEKIDSCLKPGKTSEGAPKSKVDKWKWLREKDNIKKLRTDITSSTKAVNNLIQPLKL